MEEQNTQSEYSSPYYQNLANEHSAGVLPVIDPEPPKKFVQGGARRQILVKKIVGFVVTFSLFAGGIFILYLNYGSQLVANKTVKPVVNNENEPVEKEEVVTELKFFLPDSWTKSTSDDSSFQIGYDPAVFEAKVYSGRIDLVANTCCKTISVKIYPYDGSEELQFIQNRLGEGNLSKTSFTRTKKYLVNGSYAVFLVNVEMTDGDMVGMVDTEKDFAFLVTAKDVLASELEPVLKTLKLTQRD